MDSLRCHQCREQCTDLESHLAEYHLKWCPFECGHCGDGFGTESAVRRHHSFAHPAAKVKFSFEEDEDRKPQLASLLAAALRWNGQLLAEEQPPQDDNRNASPNTTGNISVGLFNASLPHTPKPELPQPSSLERSVPPERQVKDEPAASAVSSRPQLILPESVSESETDSHGVKLVTPGRQDLAPKLVDLEAEELKREDQSAMVVQATPVTSGRKGGKAKITCRLCQGFRSNTLGIRTADHAFKHLSKQGGEPRYRCSVAGCDFGTPHTNSIKAHQKLRHSSIADAGFEDREALMLPKAQRVHLQCFRRSLDSSFAAHPRIVWCKPCHKDVFKRDVRKHVLEEHLKHLAIHKCPVCDYGDPTQKEVSKHLQQVHNETGMKPVNQGSLHAKEIKATMHGCFGGIVKGKK